MSFLVELPLSEYNPHAFAQFTPTVGFTAGNALAMAWISQLAYETRLPEKIGAICQLWHLTDLQIIQQPAKTTLPLSDTKPRPNPLKPRAVLGPVEAWPLRAGARGKVRATASLDGPCARRRASAPTGRMRSHAR
jgi:hypothetical protein